MLGVFEALSSCHGNKNTGGNTSVDQLKCFCSIRFQQVSITFCYKQASFLIKLSGNIKMKKLF